MKGISPLIAAVLLIAFTVAIATLISGWFTTLATKTTSTVSNRTDIAVNCAGSGVAIDQIYTNTGGVGSAFATARATVRNNGLANLSIVSAQFFNSTGNNFTTATTLPVVLNRGNVTTLAFNSVNMSACPSGFSRVVVTTDCGGVGATFDSTPKCL